MELTKVIAKVIILDENDNILLIRRSKTDNRRPLEWDVPGGMVELGESYQAGAVRETKEEVNFVLEPSKTAVVYSTCDMTDYGNLMWVYYVARVNNTEPILSDEHDKYQWVTAKEALNAITYGRQNKAITYITTNNLLPPKA